MKSTSFAPPHPPSLWLVLAALVLGCESGANVDLPETFPVSGRVLDKSGEPVSSGAVEFRSVTETTVRAVGEIQADGSFVLQTHVDTSAAIGAIPGDHEVTIHVMREGDHAPTPWTMRRPLTVKSEANEFTLTVPK